MGYIYKVVNTVNNKAYIGQTRQSFASSRYKQHLSKGCGSRLVLEDVDLFGRKAFTCEVLEQCSDEDLDARETFYIQEHNTLHPNGYNVRCNGVAKNSVFECPRCHFKSTRWNNFKQHLQRKIVCKPLHSHLSTDEILQQSTEARRITKKHICVCGKSYANMPGLSYHRKTCVQHLLNSDNNHKLCDKSEIRTTLISLLETIQRLVIQIEKL